MAQQFTAECSHIFHFNCIASSVQHGNHVCPICRSTWTNLPSQFRTTTPLTINPPLEFADDEPLLVRPQNQTPEPEPTPTLAAVPLQTEGIAVRALPEYPALSQSEQSDSFAVYVGIKAPTLPPEAIDSPQARAPIDLVAVLDVSSSMDQYGKIGLLKQAVNFVVENLGPADRFSIVTFSTFARRVTPLMRMTDNGQAHMASAINSLRAEGCTNIIAGLRKAVQILEQRREKNPVSSIILLSDGQDNQSSDGFYNALNRLPVCIRSRNIIRSSDSETLNNVVSVPVHTFGFGSDHDARALHAVADESGGTFSYVESIEVIQDAFAQCLGGLLSVVAKDVKIQVDSVAAEVGIVSISSGRYRNTIDSIQQQHGLIYVGDLYAEEEKKFLVYLSIPQQTGSSTTRLVEVKCSHKDPVSNADIETETKVVEIKRLPSEDLTEEDKRVCLEVVREKNRVSIAEAIAEAQEMAERGELSEARSLLEQRRLNLRSTVSQFVDDAAACDWLEEEVVEMQAHFGSRRRYEAVGRAYALSRGSSHMYQRAATQALNNTKRMRYQAMSDIDEDGEGDSFVHDVFGASRMTFGCSAQMSSRRRRSVFVDDCANGVDDYSEEEEEENQGCCLGDSDDEDVGGPVCDEVYVEDSNARMNYGTSFMRKMVGKSQLLRKSGKDQGDKGAENSNPSNKQ